MSLSPSMPIYSFSGGLRGVEADSHRRVGWCNETSSRRMWAEIGQCDVRCIYAFNFPKTPRGL